MILKNGRLTKIKNSLDSLFWKDIWEDDQSTRVVDTGTLKIQFSFQTIFVQNWIFSFSTTKKK